MVGGSGDDRLSRQWHYHGPGGLNGRVRDGNGWGPAGIVAGKQGRGGQASTVRVSTRDVGVTTAGKLFVASKRTSFGRLIDIQITIATDPRWMRRDRHRSMEMLGLEPRSTLRPGQGAGPDRGGQACRLLGPVGCDGHPSCTPGLSTWSSSRSLHSLS